MLVYGMLQHACLSVSFSATSYSHSPHSQHHKTTLLSVCHGRLFGEMTKIELNDDDDDDEDVNE
jgi:hypothetical protein